MPGWVKGTKGFGDVQEVLDRAIAAPKGIRIPLPTRRAAIELRSRANYYRKLDRDTNSKSYPEGHPMHGSSAYDGLVLRIPPKGSAEEHILYIEPRSASDLDIQEIQ